MKGILKVIGVVCCGIVSFVHLIKGDMLTGGLWLAIVILWDIKVTLERD